MRLNGHSCGRGYNARWIPSIWCAPQAPSCQTHIYTVLKAALRKADKSNTYGGQMHGVMIAIEHTVFTSWTEKYYNLWCELGRLLLRQSHLVVNVTECLIVAIHPHPHHCHHYLYMWYPSHLICDHLYFVLILNCHKFLAIPTSI